MKVSRFYFWHPGSLFVRAIFNIKTKTLLGSIDRNIVHSILYGFIIVRHDSYQNRFSQHKTGFRFKLC